MLVLGLPALAWPALPPALVAALPGSADAPVAGRLTAFFAQGRSTFASFCAPAGHCDPRQQKALFDLFFRGSFAQPDARTAYASEATAYFTEPDYACRRPLTARVLERLWQLPASTPACAASLPFLLDGENGERRVQHVQAARVAGVHLLFAGPSGKSFSRFGHVGLRLVICAPERREVDASCDEDLHDHLALGFRAAVDEFDLSFWKGLTGGYSLRLFAGPFMQAYNQYTVDDFRSLSSLPLRLGAGERQLLVQALAEVHWRWQNEYRFFSRNCASELSWLLRVVSLVAEAEPAWLDGSNVRPDRLFRRALASPAFDSGPLRDLQQAEKDGFYFPSSTPYYQLALDTLRARLPAEDQDLAPDFEAFRALDAVTRRHRLYEPALAAGDESAIRRNAHAALVLEAWRERHERRALLASLARYYARMTERLLDGTDYFTAEESGVLMRCMQGFLQSDGVGRQQGVPVEVVLPESGCDMRAPAFQTALSRLLEVAPVAALHERQLAELQVTVDTVNWLLPQTGLVPDTISSMPQG